MSIVKFPAVLVTFSCTDVVSTYHMMFVAFIILSIDLFMVRKVFIVLASKAATDIQADLTFRWLYRWLYALVVKMSWWTCLLTWWTWRCCEWFLDMMLDMMCFVINRGCDICSALLNCTVSAWFNFHHFLYYHHHYYHSIIISIKKIFKAPVNITKYTTSVLTIAWPIQMT